MRKSFAITFAATMLLFSVCHLFLFISCYTVKAQIETIQSDIALETAKIRKQQAEYDEYTAQLPTVLKELKDIEPEAQAAMEWVETMRNERKTLRKQLSDVQTALESKQTIDYSALQKQADDLYQRYETLKAELEALKSAQ